MSYQPKPGECEAWCGRPATRPDGLCADCAHAMGRNVDPAAAQAANVERLRQRRAKREALGRG